MYADDVLLVFKATNKGFKSVRKILDAYKNLIGQAINYNKSEIFFPKYATPFIKNTMCNALNMKHGSFPFKYLGSIISPRRAPSSAFNYIMDIIQSRIGGCQNNFIS